MTRTADTPEWRTLIAKMATNLLRNHGLEEEGWRVEYLEDDGFCAKIASEPRPGFLLPAMSAPELARRWTRPECWGIAITEGPMYAPVPLGTPAHEEHAHRVLTRLGRTDETTENEEE